MSYSGTGPSGEVRVLQSDGTSIPSFEKKRFNNIITVGKASTAQFSSIKSAVDSIIDSSSSNRYSVNIGPGTYVESPIVLPTYVSLDGTPNTITIVPADDDSPLISISGVSFINSVQLFTPSNSIGIILTNGANVNLNRVLTLGPNVGLRCDANSTLVGTELVYNYLSSGQSGVCIHSDSDDVIVSTIQMINAPTGIIIDTGDFTITNFTIKNSDAGIRIDADSVSDIRVGNFIACQTGIHIGPNTTGDFVSNIGQSNFKGVSISDIKSEATSGVINITNSNLRGDQLDILDFGIIKFTFFDEKGGDESFRIFSELTVGAPEFGNESVFGEGDSYTRGMLVYQSGAGSGSLVDLSAEARSDTGSTFSFDGVGSGNALYISSDLNNFDRTDKLKFHGLKSKNASLISSGTIVSEYWDGSSWVGVNCMSTAATGDYMHYGKDVWKNVSTEQIRFDALVVGDGDWTKNDPIGDGTDRYWVRLRVTEDLDALPQLEQFKLHSSRTEINSDGFIELFGNARTISKIEFDIGAVAPAASSPGNQDVYLSDVLDIGRTENSFTNTGSQRTGFVSALPLDLDTSSPIRFEVIFAPEVGTGDIQFNIRWAPSEDADQLYLSAGAAPSSAPNQKLATAIVTPLGANIQQRFTVDIDVSDFKTRRPGGNGDLLWLTFERDSGDANTGTVNVLQAIPFYTKWSLGGHVTAGGM